MNFNFIPSLEHIALVTVASSMWTKPDIKDLVKPNDILLNTLSSNQLDKTVAKVKERVVKIPLPELLQKEVSRFIRPMGNEMWSWLHGGHGYSSLDMKNTDEFFWTNQGIIDTKKTAQKSVQDDKIDLDTRYKIAAIHCLEDDFNGLKKKYENVHEVCDVSFPLLMESRLRNEFALAQQNFSFCSDSDLSDFKSHNACMFYYAARSGNEAATRYFLQKLTLEEKEKTLFLGLMVQYLSMGILRSNSSCLWSHHSRLPHILFLVLSVMSKEQRTKAFDRNFCQILRRMLDYPWHYLFLEAVEQSWTFLDNGVFSYVMNYIASKIERSYDDYDYENLLSVFWAKCPIAIKKYWLSMDSVSLRDMLLSCGNTNSELYLNDLLMVEGKEVIFQNKGKNICKLLIERKLWDLFTFFIRKCISSRDLMVKFKKEFSEFITLSRFPWPKDMREMSLNIIQDCIRGFNKRGTVEDHQSAKQLCVMETRDLN